MPTVTFGNEVVVMVTGFEDDGVIITVALSDFDGSCWLTAVIVAFVLVLTAGA